MRKFLAILALFMLLPLGVANAKEKEKEKEKDGKHEPVHIIIFEWEFAWPPIYRIAPTEDVIASVIPESECE
jgi:hypothetical protein